jgi:hypothetical protein
MQAKHVTLDAVGRHIFPLESLGIITCAFLAHPSEVLSLLALLVQKYKY